MATKQIRNRKAIEKAMLTAALAAAMLAPAAAEARRPSGCAAVHERAEAALSRGLYGCLRRAARVEARGGRPDANCEALVRIKYDDRLKAAVCFVGHDAFAPEEAFPGRRGEVRRGLVDVGGEIRDLEYEVIDGVAVLEGDIILGNADELDAKDSALRGAPADGGIAPQALVPGFVPQAGTRKGGSSFVWPNNLVPFEIESTLPQAVKDNITSAVGHWNANTIVRLQARNGEADFVRFVAGEGCSSSVGRQGGRQNINLNDCSRGSIIHEIGHAVGLFHEQTRIDRDDSIVVHLENVEEGKEHNFDKYSSSSGVDRGLFDFNSIMLYGSFYFSKNDEATITKKDGTTFDAQRNGLSAGDIAGITLMITNAENTTGDKLRNQQSNLCMDVSGGSRSSQAAVVQNGCTGADRQRWFLYRHPRTGRQLIINRRSGMCLDVPGASTNPLVGLQQFPCHGGSNQGFTGSRFWIWEPWQLKNDKSGLCIEAPGSTGGGRVRQNLCIGNLTKWFQEYF